MRIAVMGASGRVGTRLMELILANPGLELAAALVRPGSKFVGVPISGSSIEYRATDAEMNSRCDVMIDFSQACASLELQEQIGCKSIPMVIGTTGFTAEEDNRLSIFTRHRPMLISANFAPGFEAFKRAAVDFTRRIPDAEVAISETYDQRKKMAPSGTSLLLAHELCEARSRAMGFSTPEPAITVKREGETVGINEVHFRMGLAETTLTYRVETLTAYAAGAITAAQWLVSIPRPAGRYSLADSLND